ncbi:MAG: DNA-3-methyladenine glycosylase [Hyphomicrobiales bacterium]
MKLTKEFYLNEDVVGVAKSLIGKILYTNFGGITAAMITETEAYAGITDKASHAYNNKKTKRTSPMFKEGGISYVYLCYGIHSLFNVVTNAEDIPHAILIRAISPTEGLDIMKTRTNKVKVNSSTFNGPGKVSKALGIKVKHSDINLEGKEIWIEDNGIIIPDSDIQIGPRIGIDYAEEDAKLPYRFLYTR